MCTRRLKSSLNVFLGNEVSVQAARGKQTNAVENLSLCLGGSNDSDM